MSAGRICCECQQAIFGEAREIVQHAPSGVRPNDWAHPPGLCPQPVRRRPTAIRQPGRQPARRP